MNALKKINERVKQLQKKHPKSKRTTLQKQAGREWKAGKLAGKKRKSAPKKKAVARKRKTVVHKPAKRKAARRKVTTRVVVVGKIRRRRRPAAKARHTRRRVSGKGPSIMPMVALGALAVGGYLLLSKGSTPQQNSYIPTGNYQRDNSAANVLAYATAAGLAASAIAKLIDALNNSSDSQVTAAAANPQASISQFFSGD